MRSASRIAPSISRLEIASRTRSLTDASRDQTTESWWLAIAAGTRFFAHFVAAA